MLDAVERAQGVEAYEALLLRFEGMKPDVDRSPDLIRAEIVLRRGLGDWRGAAARLEDQAGHAKSIQAFETALNHALRHLIDVEDWPGVRRVTEKLGAPHDVDSSRLLALWALSAPEGEAGLAARSVLTESLAARPGEPWLLTGMAVSAWRSGHWGRAYLAADAALATGVDLGALVATVRASALAYVRPDDARILFDNLPETALTVRHRALELVHRVRPQDGLVLLDDWLTRYPRDTAAEAIARRLRRMVERMPIIRDDESEP